MHMAAFHAVCGHSRASAMYSKAAAARAECMDQLMNDGGHCYRDLDGRTGEHRPVEAFTRSGLLVGAGVQASTCASGEQWDAPNVWAPLNHILVLGLLRIDKPWSRACAAEIAHRFLKAVSTEWQATGHMHEKYHASGTG